LAQTARQLTIPLLRFVASNAILSREGRNVTPKLSIVTTLYRSAPHIEQFHARVAAAAEKITSEFEIIMVNDGSPDGAQGIAEELCRRDSRVSVVELSRNFGHHKAMMTGLSHARGNLVFLIDSDLEEDPELLLRFHDELISRDVDVVYGVQELRKGALFERFTGSVFYMLFNALSTAPIPRNLITARLMRASYVRALCEYRDREIFIAGLWAITGFRQLAIAVTKASSSKTTYNFARKVAILVNGVTSFSVRPLLFVFYLGCAISVVAGIMGTYLVGSRLFLGTVAEGWLSLMVTMWFLGGLTIFSLGIIGIYLSKIFIETKDRPFTTIRSVHGPIRVTPVDIRGGDAIHSKPHGRSQRAPIAAIAPLSETELKRESD
jgi:putative glycosyltransferase